LVQDKLAITADFKGMREGPRVGLNSSQCPHNLGDLSGIACELWRPRKSGFRPL